MYAFQPGDFVLNLKQVDGVHGYKQIKFDFLVIFVKVDDL